MSGLLYADAVLRAQNILLANTGNPALGDDSIISNIISMVASVLDEGYNQINDTSIQLAMQSATGVFLDNLCALVNVYRLPGDAATGNVVITMSPAPTVAQVISAGTILSTNSNPPIYFKTAADTTIPAGVGSSSSSPSTPVTAAFAGSNANVGANTILIVNFQLVSGTLTVTNAAATSGGTDPEDDQSLRDRGLVATQTKYGPDDMISAIVAVSGVWDAAILDTTAPIGSEYNNTGSITATNSFDYYWCDSSGNQPGAGTPNTGLALAVQNAVTAQKASAIVPVQAAFTVISFTTIYISYRCLPTISPSQIEPQIQQAVLDFVQATKHNTQIDSFSMGAYVQTAVNGVLLYFAFTGYNSTGGTSDVPVIATAGTYTIYRALGAPSSVVCTAV